MQTQLKLFSAFVLSLMMGCGSSGFVDKSASGATKGDELEDDPKACKAGTLRCEETSACLMPTCTIDVLEGPRTTGAANDVCGPVTCWAEVRDNAYVAVDVDAAELGQWTLYFVMDAFAGGAQRAVNVDGPWSFQAEAVFGSATYKSTHRNSVDGASSPGTVQVEYEDTTPGSAVLIDLNAPLQGGPEQTWSPVRARFRLRMN
jgi:hypothetical protein